MKKEKKTISAHPPTPLTKKKWKTCQKKKNTFWTVGEQNKKLPNSMRVRYFRCEELWSEK